MARGYGTYAQSIPAVSPDVLRNLPAYSSGNLLFSVWRCYFAACVAHRDVNEGLRFYRSVTLLPRACRCF